MSFIAPAPPAQGPPGPPGPTGSQGQAGNALPRIDVAGHSCPGAGGTVAGDQNGYVDRLALALGARRRANIAQGGATACWPAANASGDGGYSWVLNNFQPPNSGDSAGGYLPNTSLVIPHFGFEDLATLGSARPAAFKEALRTIISRYCSAALYEDTDATWTYGTAMSALTGNWSYSTGNAHYCQWGGALNAQQFAQWACPSDYPGNAVIAIGMSLIPGTLGNNDSITVTITVDGTAYDLVLKLDSANGGLADAESGKANGIVLRLGRSDCGLGLSVAGGGLGIPALAAGAHTIKVALKSATVTGAFFLIDYAQIEADPLDGPVVVVPGSWRPLAGGQSIWNGYHHGYNAATDPMTDAKITAWNAHIQEVLTDFPSRSLYVDIDSTATGLNQQAAYFSGDGIHPSNRGHALVAKIIADAIIASGLVTPRVVARYSRRQLGANFDGGIWRPIGGAFGTSIGVAFSNSWVNYGVPFQSCAYRKDLDGHVFIRGCAKQGGAGAANSAIHALSAAAGYKPTDTKDTPVVTYSGAAYGTGQLRRDSTGSWMAGGGQTAAGSFQFIDLDYFAEGT